MDIGSRELILKSEKKRKSGALSFMIFFITAMLGGGLILLGIKDYRTNGSGPVNNVAELPTQVVQGISTCGTFNSLDSSIFSEFTGLRKWILTGDEITDQEKTISLSTVIDDKILDLDDGYELKYRIANTSVDGDLILSAEGVYKAEINLKDISPGTYRLEAYLDHGCGTIRSNPYEFNVSYPLYLVWTIDWEGYEITQSKLTGMDTVSKRHSNIPMSHFFNPRYLINGGNNTSTQRSLLVNYLVNRRNNYGDSIGLHIHAYPDVLAAAGVPPQSDPRWGWTTNDGYDVMLTGFQYSEMKKLLSWSDSLFRYYGLGSPNTFRAAGWHADEGTLKALEDSGYLLDSSGREQFVLGNKGIKVPWTLSAKTQPYRPNYNDQNSSSGDQSQLMKLWEFPNNGLDSTALTADQMYSNFRENYSGKPLSERRTVNYLSHADYFQIDQPRIDQLFTYTDKHLYKDDKGPVIYENIENVYNFFVTY
jgi:hypothetical protein